MATNTIRKEYEQAGGASPPARVPADPAAGAVVLAVHGAGLAASRHLADLGFPPEYGAALRSIKDPGDLKDAIEAVVHLAENVVSAADVPVEEARLAVETARTRYIEARQEYGALGRLHSREPTWVISPESMGHQLKLHAALDKVDRATEALEALDGEYQGIVKHFTSLSETTLLLWSALWVHEGRVCPFEIAGRAGRMAAA